MMSGNSLIITATALVGLHIAPLPEWATLPLAVMFVGVIITTYPASMLMERVGRRTGFTLGAVLGISGGLVSAWAISKEAFYLFCVGSLLLGSFNAFGQYYRFAAAETADPGFRSRAISYVLAGGVLAAFIGPNLAKVTRGMVDAQFAASYACVAVLYCCSLLLIQALRLERPEHKIVDTVTPSLLSILRGPVFLVAVLSGTVGYGVMNLLMTATPLAMTDHGFHFDHSATVIQWHVFGMFAPAFFTGHLIRRFGTYQVMIAGTVALLVCCLVNLSGTGYWQFLAALVLLGVGWNFCFIGATTLLSEVTTARGKVQGLNDFLIFFTVAITAIVSGQLHHRVGWEAINMYVVPVILVVMVALFWAWFRQGAVQPAA